MTSDLSAGMLCRRKGRAAIRTPPAGAFTLSPHLSHELRQSAVSQGGTHPAALAATLTCVITAWEASRLWQGSPLTHSECFYPQGDRFGPHHHRLQVSVSELQKKNILGRLFFWFYHVSKMLISDSSKLFVQVFHNPMNSCCISIMWRVHRTHLERGPGGGG